MNPKVAETIGARGDAYFGKQEYDRAIADYDEAILLDPKLALGYIGRGNAYRAKGDYDHAISDYNRAITLDPKSSVAYTSRGDVYKDKGDFNRAILDYNEAIILKPQFAEVHINRGWAYLSNGDHERAVADYTAAIAVNESISTNAKSGPIYFSRGFANFYGGKITQALDDLYQSKDLSPKNAYAAIWLDIASKRSNRPSELALATAKLDMAKWPAPVLRLFLGDLTPTAVLAAADDPRADIKNARVCEANFYSGELALQQGIKGEAARLFRLAATQCPKDFYESLAANFELKALGKNR